MTMITTNLSRMTIYELLATHSAVLAELRDRGVLRSKNTPTGDLAEWLVSNKLGLKLAVNAAAGFDATDANGLRYQIKARRVTPDNKSSQLGVIRNLSHGDFDFLIGVIFDADWQVIRAAKIPHQAVAGLATFRKHQNGHVMHLRPSVFNTPSVEDISGMLSGHLEKG